MYNVKYCSMLRYTSRKLQGSVVKNVELSQVEKLFSQIYVFDYLC